MGKYASYKSHFETKSERVQRGKTLDAGITAYAAHLLDRLQPEQGAKLLEIGCGDGLPMRKIRELRPDLHIDGIELSQTLANEARNNNPGSQIWEGNALDIELPKEIYDAIFSFSFLQYIAPEDVYRLQLRLARACKGGG